MRNKLYTGSALLVSISVLCLFSCKKPAEGTPEEPVTPMTGEIHPYFGTGELALDNVYTLSDGTKFKVTDMKFYSSNVLLENKPVASYPLFDFRQRGNLWFNTADFDFSGSTLNFNVGVDADVNHDDPTEFPNDSWLNIMNSNDMYWSWSQGFIFLMIEGKADTIPDGTDNFDLSFSYHLGTDTYYGDQLQFNVNPSNVTEDHMMFKLKFDFKAFFENADHPIDLPTEYITHAGSGQDALSVKVKRNFQEAFSAL